MSTAAGVRWSLWDEGLRVVAEQGLESYDANRGDRPALRVRGCSMIAQLDLLPAPPRVIDDAGRDRCPSCHTELRRRHCARCERIGAVQPTLIPRETLS